MCGLVLKTQQDCIESLLNARVKENGASIEVDGQKVALGIPIGNKPAAGNPYAEIPLGRAGTAGKVACSVLALSTSLTSYITGR